MSKNKVIDEGNSNKYFFQIPNLIDDYGLSALAFRLYAHLKRVAGDESKCWQSARTLAEVCKIGVASISRAKKELVSVGLITIVEIPNDKGKGRRPYHEIRIVDIWNKNMQQYSKIARSKKMKTRSKVDLARSDGDLKKIESLRISLEEALKIWATLFPTKPKPRPTTKSLQATWRTRMKDKHFRDNWKPALKVASQSPALHKVSWFNFYFFIKNDRNYQKCIVREWVWLDEKLAKENNSNQSLTAELESQGYERL